MLQNNDRKRPEKPSLVAPSIVGSDVRVTGDIATPGELQFDGTIEGDIHCGSLTVGEQAAVTGGVVSDTVLVHGSVIGTIRARSVHLSHTAKVVGDIWHEDMVVESGAFIEGRCAHVDNPLEGTDAEGQPHRKFIEARATGLADSDDDDISEDVVVTPEIED